MIREIHEWIDEKMDEVYEEENDKKAYAKAAGLGMVEGGLDGLAIIGAFSIIMSGVCLVCSKFKK
jgi:hypothetical protein